MILASLPAKVMESYEDLGIFSPLFNTTHTIEESNTRKDIKLRSLKVTRLPNDGNTWLFQSEIQKIDCFKNQSKTVEESIVYLRGKHLYIFMIELKSSLTAKHIKGLKDKFKCSLVQIGNFLTMHQNFRKLENVKLYPIGVCAFSHNQFLENHVIKESYIPRSRLQENFLKFDFKANSLQKTLIEIQPPNLDRMSIDLIFCQNPAWINTYSDSDNFDINFQDLINSIHHN